MILNNEYLSDEELEQLISEVEADDLVPAPPELKENIIHAVFGELHIEAAQIKEKIREAAVDIPNPPPEIKKRKQKEFAAYCFRVGMSVAAAVAFIFIMPYLPEFGGTENVNWPPGAMQDDVNPPDIPEWEKEAETEERLQDYPTKEEVLNETTILQKVLEGSNILRETNYFNIFTEKDGGQ